MNPLDFMALCLILIVWLVIYYKRCHHDYKVLEKIVTPSVVEVASKSGASGLSNLSREDFVSETRVIVVCTKCGKIHTYSNR